MALLPAHTDPEGRAILNALLDATAVRSDQTTAADLVSYHLPPIGADAYGERRQLRLAQIEVVSLTACAAGESMVYTVKRDRAGVLTTIGTLTIDSTTTTRRVTAELSDQYEFDKDDLVVLDRNYTAGGGPTPMAINLVRITWRMPFAT